MVLKDVLADFQTETALMYDAVHLFAKALHDLDSSQRIDINPLSCDAVDTWPHGYSLINYMKIVSENKSATVKAFSDINTRIRQNSNNSLIYLLAR